jgi:hypothetical protein
MRAHRRVSRRPTRRATTKGSIEKCGRVVEEEEEDVGNPPLFTASSTAEAWSSLARDREAAAVRKRNLATATSAA